MNNYNKIGFLFGNIMFFMYFVFSAICGKCRTEHYRLRSVEDSARASNFQQIAYTVFPRISTRALIKNFGRKGGCLLEGGHLIKGGAYYVFLYDSRSYWSSKAREWSSCAWKVYCIYKEHGDETKIKGTDHAHKRTASTWGWKQLLVT